MVLPVGVERCADFRSMRCDMNVRYWRKADMTRMAAFDPKRTFERRTGQHAEALSACNPRPNCTSAYVSGDAREAGEGETAHQ
jgi:hypothetical protein